MTENPAKITQISRICPLCGGHMEQKSFFPKSSGFGWQCVFCGFIFRIKSGFFIRDYSEMR